MAGLRLPVRSVLPHCSKQLRMLSSLTLMELPARARAAARVAAKAAAREAKAKDAEEWLPVRQVRPAYGVLNRDGRAAKAHADGTPLRSPAVLRIAGLHR